MLMKKEKDVNTGEELKKALGPDLYKKLIYSILRAQSEITRTFDIPIGGEFISFENATLVWHLTGKQISKKDASDFYTKDNKNEIRLYAIRNLKRGQKLSGSELQKISLSLYGETSIKVYPKNHSLPAPIKESWFEKVLNSIKAAWNSFINFWS